MPADDLLPRSITPLLQHAGQTFPAVSITGPRQSGKSSLATTAFPSHRVAIMESPDVLDAVKRDARAFLRSFDDATGAILDEVQRAPELLSYLLEEIDRDLRTGRRMGRWILTGSESLLLSHRISQSLAGRVAVFELLPMSHGELRGFPRRRGDASATLGRAVLLGGYPPIHARRPHPTSWFASYVASYLERDVRSIVQIGELSLFQRFLTMCAGRTAQLLNLSALAADIGVSQPTARAWMSVLEATYIVKLVPGWYGNISKRLVKAPKLHFIDTGLACALLGISDEKVLDTHPLRGPLVESWFAGELLKAQAAHGLRSRIFHWRDQNAAEADLVVDLGGKLTVIEVKSAMTVHQDWARALERMTSALPADTRVERVIVHGGGDEMPPLKGTTLVPWSRAAEFATRVFAEGSGKLPAAKLAKVETASKQAAAKGSRGVKQAPAKRKTAAEKAAAKRSLKKKGRRA